MAGVTLEPGEAGSRGCGKPQKNKTYLRPPYDPDGVPLDTFFFCPPKPLSMKLPARGVKMHERNGVWHVYKRIGLKSYPSCYGWTREALLKGPSVRVSSKLDFSLLTKASRLIMVHPKAILTNAAVYRGKMREEFEGGWCRLNDGHREVKKIKVDVTCMRTWQCDMDMDGVTDESRLSHTYYQGDMKFLAYPRHPEIDPLYEQGIVASIPMSIAVINGDKAQKVYDSIESSIRKEITNS